MAFTKIAAAGIGSTGTVTLQNVVVTGSLSADSLTGAASTANINANSLNVTGVSTFSTILVGTAVTISGGIVTATSFRGDGSQLTGIAVTANVRTNSLVVSGVSTFQNSVKYIDNAFAYFGNSDDLYIGHNGSISAIADAGTGDLYIAGDNALIVTDLSYTENKAKFNTNGSVELYYDNLKTFETIGAGATVSGTTFTNQLDVSGIGTITTLFGTTLRNYGETVNNIGNTGTAATINLTNGNFVTATLTANCTFTFTTGLSSGAISFTLLLTNDGTAGRSIIWPAAVKWPNASVPVRTTDANKTDVYTFFTYDNGTTWWGNLSLYNYS